MLSSAQIHNPAEANVHAYHHWQITVAGPPILLSKRDVAYCREVHSLLYHRCPLVRTDKKGAPFRRMANGVDVSDVRGVDFASTDDFV